MDADLSVESTPGVGSRFFFALPLVPADDSRSNQRGAGGGMLLAHLAPETALTALVADDSTVNRRILASLLESAGVKVIAAAGGLEAVRLAREHHPDVVFMDLRMSDLDGLEATRRLRADRATLDIPVIAVTASAFGDTRQAAREAGCVDYLSKPVRAEDLFALLRTHTGARFVDGGAPPEAVSFDQIGAQRRQSAAARLRQALVVGDVTDLEQLSRELGAGTAAEAALGRTIAAMATDFDFEGLGRLAASLTPEGASAGD
jgi:CheY-like chemotaxis protein